MLQFPERYKPAYFILCGFACAALGIIVTKRLPDALWYLILTGKPWFLLTVILTAFIGWGAGITSIFHGVFLWRKGARKYKPVAHA